MRNAATTRTLKFGDLSSKESMQLERELARARAAEKGRVLAFEGQRRNSQRVDMPRLLDVPEVMQTTEYRCGPASLRAVLSYYRFDDVCEAKLAQELNTCSRKGTEVQEIERAAQRRGLSAQIREGMTLADLDRYLHRGMPVIVNYQAWPLGPAVESWADHWGDGHYSVVVGLSATHVILEDPWLLGRPDTIPHAEFLDRWHGGENSEAKRFVHGGVIIERPAVVMPPRARRRATESNAA